MLSFTSSCLLISFATDRKSRHDRNMTRQETLIDLSLSGDQSNLEQRPDITLMTDSRPRESAHSSDTIIKTPHQSSLVNFSPSALELFENDISFHSADELGLDGDLVAEHDIRPSIIHAQVPSGVLPEMTAAQEVREADTGHNKATSEYFLDNRQKEETEPGGIDILRASTGNQTSPDPSTTDVLRKSFKQDLTTIHERFTIRPTALKSTVPEFPENECQVLDTTDPHQALIKRE